MESAWEIGSLSHPNVEYRSSQSIVVSWTMESSWEIGNLSRPKVEYQGSRLVDGGVTPGGSRELFSLAARLMSLSPDYSIRRAFDFE